MQPNKRFRFLPFEKYTIQTALSEEEVLERLQIITRTTDTIRFSFRKAVILRSNYEYNGEIHGKSFEIWRNIRYRNSFLPVIRGTVSSGSGGTEIRLSMRMNLFVMVFMGIWLSIAGLATLGSLSVVTIALLKFKPASLNAFLLIPLGIFLFGYLLMLLAFKAEAKISRKDLNRIFEVPTNPNTSL